MAIRAAIVCVSKASPFGRALRLGTATGERKARRAPGSIERGMPLDHGRTPRFGLRTPSGPDLFTRMMSVGIFRTACCAGNNVLQWGFTSKTPKPSPIKLRSMQVCLPWRGVARHKKSYRTELRGGNVAQTVHDRNLTLSVVPHDVETQG